MPKVRIHLIDTQTKEEGWYVFDIDNYRAEDFDDPEGFYWTDGNASCDCERGRCLAEVLGKPDPHIQCGDTRIKIIEATVDDKIRSGWVDKD